MTRSQTESELSKRRISVTKKRCLDVSISLPLLLLCFPVLCILALSIWVESPGSPLYRQKRIGMGGEHFVIWKLRSMGRSRLWPRTSDGFSPVFRLASDGSQVPGISRSDPRVTRLGKLLRMTSLDELPQLVQVLAGTMSMVGPRPHTLEDILAFPPGYSDRHKLPPGVTGLWQVSGRNDLSTKQMLELDLIYIQNQSIRGDLLIIGRTPLAILRTNETA